MNDVHGMKHVTNWNEEREKNARLNSKGKSQRHEGEAFNGTFYSAQFYYNV